MSDINTQRQIRDMQAQLGRSKTPDMTSLYLPWTQRVLNPFPLASSASAWGDSAQPWAISVLAFCCVVFVATTNNGSNYWTLQLLDTASNVIASFNTSAISANTYTRFAPTVSAQPSSSNQAIRIVPTATLSPGAIYIFPTVECIRTGS